MNKKEKIKLILLFLGGMALPLNFALAQSYKVEFTGYLQTWGNPSGHPSFMEKSIELPDYGRYEVCTYYQANSCVYQPHEEFKVLVDGTYIGQTTDPNKGDGYETECFGEHNFTAGTHLTRLEHAWNYSDVGGQSVYPKNVTFTLKEVFKPELSITKSVDKENAQPGDILTYTLSYQNTGQAPATEVVISDDYDETHLNIYDNGGGTVSGGEIRWDLGTLENGVSAHKIFQAQIKTDLPFGITYINNQAVIDSDETDAQESNIVETIVNNQPSPTVDIKANGFQGPITIPYNNSATLSWSSTNADSCYGSGDWSGNKATSGSQSTGNLTFSRIYTITCTGPGGSDSDSVTVNVSSNNPPVADAGPDKTVYEKESIVLEGSGFDPDGDSISYSWSCNGGSLSNLNFAQPVFYAPSISYDTTYNCNLTVTDSHGANDSDSMNVFVRVHESPTLSVNLEAIPSSGCSPLKNVDLKANVYGTADGYVTYFFDCTNDGTWEKIFTTYDYYYDYYTAYNLCHYSYSGTYNAKVRVERESLASEDTVQITVYSCSTPSYAYPNVDLKANGSDGPITIPYNNSATLSWSSTNAYSCYASNNWSGTKAISGSQSTGSLTSSKTYTITCTGSYGSDSDSVKVNVSSGGNLTISKMVRNLSDGTSWADSVFADPNEIVSFLIEVTANNYSLSNVTLKDTLPSKIIYQGELKVNGIASAGNIISGLNLGYLYPNQTKTITFRGQVAGENQFSLGQTTLTNSASAYTTQIWNSDTAKVIVSKKAVAGAATEISTGLTNNIFVDSFFLPLVIAFMIIWLFKSQIINFEEWVDLRKRKAQEYRSKKLLQLKITQIKAQELLKKKTI
jgi:hypothetical protein